MTSLFHRAVHIQKRCFLRINAWVWNTPVEGSWLGYGNQMGETNMSGLNSTGAEALMRANIIMRSAGPITGLSNIGQSYDLQPGWYDREQQLLIVG